MEVKVENNVENIILTKIQKLNFYVEAKNQEAKEENVRDYGVKVLGIMEVDYVQQNLEMNFFQQEEEEEEIQKVGIVVEIMRKEEEENGEEVELLVKELERVVI